jgi:hypothetical protein
MENPKIDKEFSEYYFRKMEMYSANAKNYIQISVGALFLPIIFSRQLLGIPDGTPMEVGLLLMFSWISFLVAIGAGLAYQYFSVKRIETRLEGIKARFFDEHPGLIYGTMLITFYLGSVLFVISAIQRLLPVHC